MDTKTIISKQFFLNQRDLIKGLLMAVLTAVISFFYEVMQNDFNDINWETIWKVALGAAIAYLFKNFVIEPPQVITYTDTNQTAKEAKVIISDSLPPKT